MSKIGFIGLGIMGKSMAKNLLKEGIELLVNDINKKAVQEVTKEGGEEASLEEIGSECKIIFLILPNGKISKDVIFSENGILNNIKEGSIICDMSSVTPDESKYCYNKLKELKVGFLDAPVSGGEEGAINGTLSFMVGGEENHFNILKKYFDIMGSSCILIGKSGSGSITKLTNQIIVNNTIAIISEAFVFAMKAGVNPEKVYHAIRGGLAGSNVLDFKIPKIIRRDFSPGGKISINHKDIGNVIDAAHKLEVAIPYTAQLYEIMQTLMIHGKSEDDHSGIIKYFEALSNIEVK